MQKSMKTRASSKSTDWNTFSEMNKSENGGNDTFVEALKLLNLGFHLEAEFIKYVNSVILNLRSVPGT